MGPILPKPVTTKVLERKETKLFHIGVGFMNGYREKMEDAHTVMPNDDEGWGFFGVFDGHCGPLCSKYVAARFEELIENPIPDDALRDLSLKIDKEFLESETEGGSTGTYVFVSRSGDKFHLQVANVGDSRIMLGRKRDRSEHSLTEDHKPINVEERQRIIAAGGHVQNNRVDGGLAVSRAFGDGNYKQLGQYDSKVIAVPEFMHFDAEVGDFILLACDGVFENDAFTNSSVVEFIFKQLDTCTDLAHISAAICDEAMQRGSKDNISAMIVQLGVDLQPTGRPEHEVRAGPMAMPGNAKFVAAYEMMCDQAGLSLGRCLEMRFDQVAEKLKEKCEETNCDDRSCDLHLLSEIDLLHVAKANNIRADISREEKISELMRLKDVDIRPPLVQQLEAEQRHMSVPAEIAAMERGSDDRTNWFRNWIDGIEKHDSNYAKLALQLMNMRGKV